MRIKGRAAALIGTAAVLAAMLLTAAPAYATTTKTSGPFTMHVVGTKLHVDYFYFTEKLHGQQTFHGQFWVEIDSANGEHQLYNLATHMYKWHDGDGTYDPDTRTFTTGRYEVDRSFPNNARGYRGEYTYSGISQHSVTFTVHT